MSTLDDFQVALSADPLNANTLAAVLNGLSEADRVTATRSVAGKDQRRIWDACQGRATGIDDFVDPATEPAREVIHAGKNSLPVFTTFEKRFCRAEGRDDVLYGYNEASTKGLIGPGYFVAHFFDARGEVGIDYLQTPPADAKVPASWPGIKPNEKGLQKFVYAGMVDYMRKVSDHVTIGRAYKGGDKELPHTFLLCRTGS